MNESLQPAQHAQLGFRVTQAIEDHYAQRVLNGGGEAGLAEHTAQGIEAQSEPPRILRRLRYLRQWSHHEQNPNQIYT